jgi:hypothetical protein
MSELDDIMWAAVNYRDSGSSSSTKAGDQAYVDILKEHDFLQGLRDHPGDLKVEEIRNILVKFLNRWGCRLRNYDNLTASALQGCLVRVHAELSDLRNDSIFGFRLENIEMTERVERLFNGLWHCGSGSAAAGNFGPTATSKLLHVMNPDFFSLWDESIRLAYWKEDDRIIESGRGYCIFMDRLREVAESLRAECERKYGTPDPARLISERLKIDPPHSILKFIDEFNWVTYTLGRQKPKGWRSPF